MSRIDVVYLGGFGRSGSTVVERVLGAAHQWVNIGELVDLARSVAPADERCGCGEPFSTCPLWSQVGEIAFGGWAPEVLDRLISLQRAAARQRHLPGLLAGRPPTSGPLIDLRADYERIYRAVAEVTGARVIVDASKGPALGLALAGMPGVDLRMLNVVRDPRAVAWSWQRHVERPHTTGGAEEMWRIPPRRSAAQWAALQLEMEAMARWGGMPFARLRYEDFVADPITSLVAAGETLGVSLTADALPAVQDGTVELGPSHGLSGNPGRFRSGGIALRADDGWTHLMPARDRAVVTALTLPLLSAYGYPARAGAVAPATTRSTRPEEHHMAGPDPVTADPAADTTPLVTVVIPTRGRPALLRDTLAAIVAQDYAGPLEVFVVHDREEADESLAELSQPGRRIIPTVNTRTGGLCGARNTGVLASSGSFVASCDDDDLWYPAKVRLQVARLLADPSLLAVGSGIRLLMGERGDVEWPAREPLVTHERLLENRVKELHSSTLMMRRAAFDVAGMYDEELPFGHGEDYDWLLRASKVGSVGAVQEILADIRKDIPSWFRDRWLNTATALEYLLEKHPDFCDRRRGHARMLGQIAYARAAAGERARAARIAGHALSRYPAAPHAWLALAIAGPGIEPRQMLSAARRLGRGLS